jgi:hypothetical protein
MWGGRWGWSKGTVAVSRIATGAEAVNQSTLLLQPDEDEIWACEPALQGPLSEDDMQKNIQRDIGTSHDGQNNFLPTGLAASVEEAEVEHALISAEDRNQI